MGTNTGDREPRKPETALVFHPNYFAMSSEHPEPVFTCRACDPEPCKHVTYRGPVTFTGTFHVEPER